MSKKFSLVIPTVRQTTMIEDCIRSVYEHEPDRSRYEIIVVDDGSDKAVQDWLVQKGKEHDFTVIKKDVNRGFAHTVNTGLAAAKGETLILVNNDIQFIQPFLGNIEAAFDADAKIGVVGAKLMYPNMQVQHAGVQRQPKTPNFYHVHKHVPRLDPAVCRSRYFISVTGALFSIRRTAYERVGKFNENYFLACEDSEYCLRIWANGLRVFYAHDVEALHQEGGTRGNSDKTKLKKGPQWFLKERETIARFCNDFKFYDAENYERHIDHLNQAFDLLGRPAHDQDASAASRPANLPQLKAMHGKVKLEIGCGYNPQPGYLHLDVRPLPDVEYVCDFAKERLPFDDNTLDEILSNHSIEHISWRELPFVVGEWFRVLKPGGRVFLRTPDLEFIARTYLDGKTTPEWPGDEAFLKENISEEITPGWWANIKLFAGQDYPSNYHFLCFDLAMLQGFFGRLGFERVNRVEVKPVFSPGELQAEAFKPELVAESAALPAGAQEQTIKRAVVRRRAALGDVILATPIVRELARELGDGWTIDVATDCPMVFKNNPYVSQVIGVESRGLEGYDRVVDLDLAYERQPKMHVLDAYAKVAWSEGRIFDRQAELFLTEGDKKIVDHALHGTIQATGKWLVVHMAVTWKNRTWPLSFWQTVVQLLREAGYGVVQIGQGGDLKVNGERLVKGLGPLLDLTNKLTIQQASDLIARASCFIGNDSSMVHVAGTTNTPIVGLFTSAKPEYRMAYREGELGRNFKALVPNISCAGCLHEEPVPVIYCDCRRGDFKCLSLITPEAVVKAVKEMSL